MMQVEPSEQSIHQRYHDQGCRKDSKESEIRNCSGCPWDFVMKHCPRGSNQSHSYSSDPRRLPHFAIEVTYFGVRQLAAALVWRSLLRPASTKADNAHVREHVHLNVDADVVVHVHVVGGCACSRALKIDQFSRAAAAASCRETRRKQACALQRTRRNTTRYL